MDIAQLGIKISSGDAVSAANNLKNFAAAAENADAANTRMARGSKAAGAAKRQQSAETKAAAAAEKAAAAEIAAAQKAQASAAKVAAQAQAELDRSMRSTAAQATNLSFQLNDVFVMLAAGQNPMMLAVQQGTQISQIFGQMGSKAQILSGLGTAFTSMINPISLVTLGVIGLGGALVQRMSSGGDEVKELSDHIDALANSVTAVNDVTKIYSMDGLAQLTEKYGEIDAAILRMIERQTELAKNIAMEDVRSAVSALADEYGGLLKAIESGGKIGAYAAMTLRTELGLTAEEGLHLKYAMDAAIAAATFEEKADALARVNDILQKSTASTGDFAQATEKAESMMRELANSAPQADWMNAALSGIKSLTGGIWDALSAMSALSQKQVETALQADTVASPQRGDPRSHVKDQYWKDRYFPAPAELASPERQSRGSNRGVARINGGKSEAEKAAETAIKTAEDLAKKYNDLVANQNDFIEKTQLEMMTIGMTEVEANKLMKTQELLNKATRDGIQLTPVMVDELTRLAQQSVDAEAKLKKMKDSYDFAFGTAKGFLTDFFDGIKSSEKVWDGLANAALNALDKISDKLLDIAIDGALNGLLGSLFGGGKGFVANTSLGSLISGDPWDGARASGGPVSGGKSYLVGERGPEIFKPTMAGDIIPNHAIRFANSNAVNSNSVPVVNNHYTINAQGAVEGTAEQIRKAIEQNNKNGVPQIAVQSIERAKKYAVTR